MECSCEYNSYQFAVFVCRLIRLSDICKSETEEKIIKNIK